MASGKFNSILSKIINVYINVSDTLLFPKQGFLPFLIYSFNVYNANGKQFRVNATDIPREYIILA